MYKRQWIIDSKDHQSRIDDFVYQHHISRKMLKAIKLKGDILVDNQPKTVRYCLQKGEVLTLVYPPENNQIPPEKIKLNIVYEDAYVLIVSKVSGMPSLPTRSHPCHTLANAVSGYYQSLHFTSTIHMVNRLDKETQGLMIIAKYREIHDMLTKTQAHIYRRYQMHVVGNVSHGVVDLPIYKDGYHMRRVIDERGKPSRTYYRCIKSMNGISLVECVLETGRTHQIRVHMAAIGYPLIGDELYDGPPGLFDLESVMIAFQHPVTKQIITIRKIK